jgi:hypothetical protein
MDSGILMIQDSILVCSPDPRIPHTTPDFCLKARLNWAKNVNEEREAPFQTLIGSMNQQYCKFIALGNGWRLL